MIKDSPLRVGASFFPQLHRWGTFPEEMLKSPWLCWKWAAAGAAPGQEDEQWIWETENLNFLTHPQNSLKKKIKISLFVDKYNFINSAEGSEKPQAALGTSPAPGKLMQCLNSSREMLTYAKKIFRWWRRGSASSFGYSGQLCNPCVGTSLKNRDWRCPCPSQTFKKSSDI